ncbi:efflux RND transporter permease subunit [Candidatus Sumerlaeota bacterium]|nr:efflux RND transporter permease subunit [Candidatus Sumerlaeota bacterium]
MTDNLDPSPPSFLDRPIRFFLENKLVVFLLILFFAVWGYVVAPFDWESRWLPRDPVPVDAIPDIGENQQIVFTEWMGRSPQDVDDQITYPLTVALMGMRDVKTIRSFSMLGFSSIYVIFNEKADYEKTRWRVLERLNSLPAGVLPADAKPTLGPDATALGQVFWYTLEGLDADGNPTGGWDLDELRSVQDYYVRDQLKSARSPGGASLISEVASVGGFVREYQVDVDPDAMRAWGVALGDVVSAVRSANIDVGARTIEVNEVEYLIRGIGFVKNLGDIENSVVKVNDNVPVYVRNVARVSQGPALRRGALDKEGAEVVGGVVVVRYGENPLAAIQDAKRKIAEISSGLPQKTLADGTVSRLHVVPFYDRTGLIYETLGTLSSALLEEILVTILVVIVMVAHLRSSILISGVLPLAVLMSFIAMKTFGVDANVVALSGIAIAVGTMVDMGIVISENILRSLEEADPKENRIDVIHRASTQVAGAVTTALATTVVSFLPVFTMVAAEGKLFKPLAFTKTFALVASLLVAIVVVPALADLLLKKTSPRRGALRFFTPVGLLALGIVLIFLNASGYRGIGADSPVGLIGLAIALLGGFHLVRKSLGEERREGFSGWLGRIAPRLDMILVLFVVSVYLTRHWMPLGIEKGLPRNFAFVAILLGSILWGIALYIRFYEPILRWCLAHKVAFLSLPVAISVLGLTIWLGFNALFGWLPVAVKTWKPVSVLAHTFPGLGKEFMPPLDEGSFLYMPTTMPHASIGEALDVVSKQDIAIAAIPEVEQAVGKIGRAETPLDPAPVSMVETIVNHKPEYLAEPSGRRLSFRFDPDATDYFRDEAGAPLPAPDGEPYVVQGRFERDDAGRLIPAKRGGYPFRLWRRALDPDLNEGREAWDGIRSPDDIWSEIVRAGQLPGTTSAPKLQPIAARIVMLQSGMRAPMGVKVKGPDLETIERTGLEIERALKQVPAIRPETVNADRIVGKPYLEIRIDREAIARYGIRLGAVQDVIEIALGGRPITVTVEGRERYPVRVRYLRELRDTIESIGGILVPAPMGEQIPLAQLADIEYVRGPQTIKSEDTFLVGYVLFDKQPNWAEVNVVEQAARVLDERIREGELSLPAGVSYSFAGAYENQIRAAKRLRLVLPLALFTIFFILYFQFRRMSTTLLVFTGIAVAWGGGFIVIWLYGQSWFLDFSVFGASLREMFQVHPINLSVAIWVGFLALFGIATDDGVIMGTYLDQSFAQRRPPSVAEIREAVVVAGKRRIRPCLMTAGTTILALIPVLTSTGRGSDIMVPMAIPSFGGMLFQIVTTLVVPVLYCAVRERALKKSVATGRGPGGDPANS